MKAKIALSVLLLISTFVVGCKTKPQEKLQYDKQLLPGQNALRKITNPADIPDFTQACMDTSALKDAISRSINYLSKPSSQKFYPSNGIAHKRVVASLTTFAGMLDSGLRGPQLNTAIRDKFDVYISVGCDDNGTVLFTGYYTPIFDGSPVSTDRFRYPLYTQPDDLVKGPNGEILGRRGAGGQMTPFPPAAEIESSGMLKGKELVWLGNPFEAYIARVQGSAKIRMPGGVLKGVGYAANNGQEYRSVGKQMVADGVLSESQLSLSAMIEYFRQHPDQVSKYTSQNPRFVFFRFEEGPPRGSLNEPVTPLRTIATDKSIFPRGALTFISTTLPRDMGGSTVQESYTGFALDQDTGGAIRAPGRCDVYVGQGDTAGRLAGQTYKEGKLYYLFLKEDLVAPTSPPMSSTPDASGQNQK